MLHDLFQVIQDRQRNPNPESYTSELLSAGGIEVSKKVGEESIEVLLAAQGEADDRLVEEVADLFYHVLVLLAWRGLTLADVEAELRRRWKD